MSLKESWKKINGYDGSISHVKNEIELLPFRYSQGKWQSCNSDDRNILTIAEFLRLSKPDCVLECGTFEARSTEFFVRQMVLHNSHPNKTFVTIDVDKCIDHISEDKVTYQKDTEYEEVVKIRKLRIDLLKRDPSVKVIYKEGLTQDLLPSLMKQYSFDFIYEDACHLPSILMKDWSHIKKYAKIGCVVCFDDMKGNEFAKWISENSNGWDYYYTDKGRGQVWIEKIQ